MVNGIINVYKEPGYTSHDVIARMRGILKQKKIGHTGTLDPQAKGVLPVCLGNATKVSDILTNESKTYEVVGLLGVVTDTQDIFGEIIEKNEVKIQKLQLIEVIESFVGEYEQTPPMYSAKKVNGKKLYELAREGIVIERKSRKVFINNIEIQDINLATNEIKLSVNCSKGTYIRTLIHDIGQILDCGACMKDLLRKRVGDFTLASSKTLSQIEDIMKNKQVDDILIKVDSLFTEYMKVIVKEQYSKIIYNGNALLPSNLKDFSLDLAKEEKIRVYDFQNNFLAIYRYDLEKEIFKPFKMFL